jgi:hypothetical protein
MNTMACGLLFLEKTKSMKKRYKIMQMHFHRKLPIPKEVKAVQFSNF